jgi:hypothetical protein
LIHSFKKIAKIIVKEPNLRSIDKASWSFYLNRNDISKIQKSDQEHQSASSSFEITF